MSNKRYTKEFWIEAVRQVVERGYSVAETAGWLGKTTHSPYSRKRGTDRILLNVVGFAALGVIPMISGAPG